MDLEQRGRLVMSKKLPLRSRVDGGEVLVEVSVLEGDRPSVLVRFPDGASLSGQGGDLWEALSVLRLELERRELLLSCNGSRRNVFPSAMLRQTSRGRLAYVLTLPRGEEVGSVVDILDPAGPADDLATVAAQREWFDSWLASDPDPLIGTSRRERRSGYNKSLGELVPRTLDVVLRLVSGGLHDLAREVERAGDGAVSDADLVARASENLQTLLAQDKLEGNIKAEVEALVATLGTLPNGI